MLPFQRRHLPDDVGPALRAARAASGRSRRDVAASVGIAPRTLARIERGHQKPTFRTLDRLCDEIGVSIVNVARRWAVDHLDVPDDPRWAPGVGLRALRLERGMTLVQLAGLAGVSAATLSRFERGITASRLLGRRPGGPQVRFEEREVALDADRLAGPFGFASGAELRRACLSAHAATAVL